MSLPNPPYFKTPELFTEAMANTTGASMFMSQRLQHLGPPSSIPGTPHTTTLEVLSSWTRDSITMYSVASSRTRDTDYGLYYTRRALSTTSDDYPENQSWNSTGKSHGLGVAGLRLAEHMGQVPMQETAEKSLSKIAVHKPPITPDFCDFYLFEGGERKVNPEYLKAHFHRKERLTEAQAMYIIESSVDIFLKEPNMVPVESPVTVCGDINGHYNDLLKSFEVGGSFQDSLYLFLGNYAKGGYFGVECLLYLYALKIYSPRRIVLLRGSHECRYHMEYTFKRECLDKYSENVYEAFLRSFRTLPISALIDGKLFCVHGGISPELINLNDINQMNRFVEINSQSHGLLCDLLWSGPFSNFGKETEPATNGPGLASGTKFIYGTRSGLSYSYTYEAVCQFLDRNNLLTIIRGDDVQSSGYRMYRKTKRNFPSVITIFSAAKYSIGHERPNLGAILAYANKHISIKQYFSDSSTEVVRRHFTKRKRIIKCKILAVSRFLKILKLLREEADNAAFLEEDIESWSVVAIHPKVDARVNAQNSTIDSNIRTFDDVYPRSDIRQTFASTQPQQPVTVPVPHSVSRRRYRNKNRPHAHEQLEHQNMRYKFTPQWYSLPESVDDELFDMDSYEDLQKLFGELFQQVGERSSRARSRLLGIF